MQKKTLCNFVALGAVALLSAAVFSGGDASPTSTIRQTPTMQLAEAAPVNSVPSADVLERALAEAAAKGVEVIHNFRVFDHSTGGLSLAFTKAVEKRRKESSTSGLRESSKRICKSTYGE
jgi:hypothetical protein